MSKTWYGHHIETIKSEDYVLHKDYIEIQDKLYKCEKVLDKIKEYIKTDAKIELYKDKSGFRTFVDGQDLLNKINELLEEIE